MLVYCVLYIYYLQVMNQNSKGEQNQNIVNLLKKGEFFYKKEIPEDDLLLINEAKKRQRPSLHINEWDKNAYFRTNAIQQLTVCQDQIQRLEVDLLNFQKIVFEQRCIRLKEPIIITGCTDRWKNRQFWSYSNLVSRFGCCKFKVGEDDDGNKIRMNFNLFIKYMASNTDDSPLYLFQDITLNNKQTQQIIEHYEVAQIFRGNLLELLDPDDRPAFKWLLIGPERSGSGIHVDPILTCAWNTSLLGCKRWVLFDGKIPEHIVTGREFKKQNETDEPMDYFLKILPQIKQKYKGQQLGLREFIQKPGQTVFVPGGMWHAVLNLEDTIAVTQNFVSSVNLEESWPNFMEERGELVIKMLQKLKEHNYELYERLAHLSKQSSQWRQTFGNKYQREAKSSQQVFFDNTTQKQVVVTKRRSLSSSNMSNIISEKSNSPKSRSFKKKREFFTDQQWFQ